VNSHTETRELIEPFEFVNSLIKHVKSRIVVCWDIFLLGYECNIN